MTMVIGMFETLVDAQRAVKDLVGSGYSRQAISVLVRGPAHRMKRDDDAPDEHGPLARATNSISAAGVVAGGPLGAALQSGGGEITVTRVLANAGLKPAAASFVADAICNGSVLVAVHCQDSAVRDARDILDIYATD